MTKLTNLGGDWGNKPGLFVRHNITCLSVSVRAPHEAMTIKAVDLRPDALALPDEHAILPALAVLNKAIEGWPCAPVTAAQVRALAA